MFQPNLKSDKYENPAAICHLPSGWVSLCEEQYLRGYCVLTAEPIVESINSLNPEKQAEFLLDMVMVGHVLMEVTGAYRINYVIMGNSYPVLHAHIVPRYLSEPDELRRIPPWMGRPDEKVRVRFDAERDSALMAELAKAILHRTD